MSLNENPAPKSWKTGLKCESGRKPGKRWEICEILSSAPKFGPNMPRIEGCFSADENREVVRPRNLAGEKEREAKATEEKRRRRLGSKQSRFRSMRGSVPFAVSVSCRFGPPSSVLKAAFSPRKGFRSKGLLRVSPLSGFHFYRAVSLIIFPFRAVFGSIMGRDVSIWL